MKNYSQTAEYLSTLRSEQLTFETELDLSRKHVSDFVGIITVTLSAVQTPLVP